jgi:intron-binding protein aquarius
MAKRKTTSETADTSAAKVQKVSDGSSTTTNVDATATAIDIKSLTVLAQRIIAAHENDTSKDTEFLDDCHDNGTIERKLWPYFLHLSNGGAEDNPSEEIAYALVLLANRRGGSRGSGNKGSGIDGGGDSQLTFVVDENDSSSSTSISPGQRTAAFALLLRGLLNYQDANCSQEENDENSFLHIAIQNEVLRFLIASYSSMELRCKSRDDNSSERRGVLEGPLVDLVGVRLWDAIPKRKRFLEMKRDGLLKKRYGLYEAKRGDKVANVGFLPGLMDQLFAIITTHDLNEGGQSATQGYISKCLELLLDLLSYPQTRTHVASYISSHNLTVKLVLSKSYRNQSFVLFRQQVNMLLDSERMEGTPSTSMSSAALTEKGVDSTQMSNDTTNRLIYQRAHTLQKLLHRHYAEEASDVVFAGVGRVTDATWLREKIGLWSENTLYDVCYRLRLVDDNDIGFSTAVTAQQLGCTRRELLTSILIYHQSSRQSDSSVLSAAPIFPTEALLWDPHSVPPGSFGLASNVQSLSLPKLNARFLSAGDYLLRNFHLFRLESAYEIRGDIVDVIKRMRPALEQDGYTDPNDYYGGVQEDNVHQDDFSRTEFQGWARMGLQLKSNKEDKQGFRIIRVDPPRLGERFPSSVIAELVLDLYHCATSLVNEWDELREFDNLFLVAVDATKISVAQTEDRKIPDEEDFSFPDRYGVQAVRGVTVLEVRDEAQVVLSDPALAYEEGGKPQPKGKRRFLRVALDPAQYAADATGRGSSLGTDVYDTFNLVIRRHGRENNFKAVLETIRGLMRGGAHSMYRSIPSWLMPVLLGFGGDPAAASFLSPQMKSFASKTAGVTSPNAALDFGDTFLDEKHLKESFPGCNVIVKGQQDGSSARNSYRVKVTEENVEATAYTFPTMGSGNPVRFTPVQVQAIRSGLCPGLNVIIGPPGTGKTDVACQIIANLYHSFPTQRTVIVTHSNAALNDLFDKVMARGDVDERYMLRLGSGERSLSTTSSSSHDFTKAGRVAHILSRRNDLLEKVQQLSESLSGAAERGADGAPSYTCETAEYFFFHHVKKKIDQFEAVMKKNPSADVKEVFPFVKYFPESQVAAMTLDDATTKIKEIKNIFEELAEFRPIELLRSQRQRTDYLLTKQAKIVAMTCTHAAIARSRLVELGFHYDNVIVEEAGQMLDIETFVPLLIQGGESDDSSASSHSRLKRVCLIGDHNQLPPVVKNISFSKFCHYDQSLFARLIKLGVPSIELNKQGRARADIARLYSWRYNDLGDLDHVAKKEEFKKANTGLVHTFQLINVDDFEGRGESTPTAYFYQNVGEAEYAVALFQYMVLIGYPPDKISILTTYNGQKELIADILSQRCGEGTPLAGMKPGAISTVDQYQGQQNNFIILSLVRTKNVGHLRDIRRLVVAVSRARLGLYVLCRKDLFCHCHELRRTMDQMAAKPTKLQLVRGEHFPTERMANVEVDRNEVHEINDVTELGELVHSMQQDYLSNQEHRSNSFD